MVNHSAQSLLAELALEDDFDMDLTPGRADSPLHEQPSRVRYATQARYRRRRGGNSSTPSGPRRRLRKHGAF